MPRVSTLSSEELTLVEVRLAECKSKEELLLCTSVFHGCCRFACGYFMLDIQPVLGWTASKAQLLVWEACSTKGE